MATQQSGGGNKAPDIKVEDIVRRFESFRKLVVACDECHSEESVNYQFCTNCGTRLSTECPQCHQPLPPVGAKFCPHCGYSIPEIRARREPGPGGLRALSPVLQVASRGRARYGEGRRR